jgi:aryl-alcohol dehydrogenase-like predicted oxidoreductase
MTSLDVNDADSMATLHAAMDAGVNFLDTAYAYGRQGESERLIARAIAGRRDQVVLATKGGLHWDDHGERVLDARGTTLKRECDESLRRLNVDHVDLLYLHAPDPDTPLTDSAAALAELQAAGKTRLVGVSNLSLPQIVEFHQVCPVSVVQPPYNMLQRNIEGEIVPWCVANDVSLAVYWPLMKGLLVGKLSRDHQFRSGDGRAKYPMFQGAEWQRNQDFVDDLRAIALEAGRTVAQLVVNWTLRQPGVTAALCGAKRAHQIEETAAAMQWQLNQSELDRIEAAIAKRGAADVRGAV